MIDVLEPKNKKEKKLTRIEQKLIKENEQLKAVIIQLTKEHIELKKYRNRNMASVILQGKTRFTKQF